MIEDRAEDFDGALLPGHLRRRMTRALLFFVILSTLGAGLAAIRIDIFFMSVWGGAVVALSAATLYAIARMTQIGWAAGTWGRSVLGGVVIYATILIAESFLPVTARDALIYHLAVPKLWLAAGRMIEIPWHEWSYFPMLLGITYTGWLKVGFEAGAALTHLAFLFIVAALIADFLYVETRSVRLGITGALLVVTMPLFLGLATAPLADLAASAFLLQGVLPLLRKAPAQSTKEILIAGIFFGAAIGTKYSAALFVVICVAFWMLTRMRVEPGRVLMQRIGLMGLAAVGIAALWLVRNFAWVQNPFHPFLGKFFGSAADTIAFTGDVPPLIHRHLVYGESWIEIALLPLRMIGGGADNNPAQFDGVLSPILFFALVPLFLKILWPWIKLSAKVAGVHFLASIILFHALVRYQTPIVCLLILLSVVGIFALRFRKIEGALVIPLLALGMHLVWSGTYLKDRLARDQPWKLLRGQESREEYLTRTVPGFSLIQTVNSSLLDNTKTYLLLTGNHYYYFDRPVEGAYFSQRPLLAWLRQSRDVDDFVAKLQAQGFSHFLLNTKSADTLLHGVLTDDEYRIWQIFLTERAAVIKRDQRYALVAIKG